MQVHTILVPVDFSPCSAALVADAVSMARLYRADLRLLHILQPVEGLSATAMVPGPNGEKPVMQALKEEAKAALDAYDTQGITTLRSCRAGHPVEGILAAIEEFRADLVVIGTHGRQGLAHLLLGSVAERIVRQSPVPVLTVRTKHHSGCAAGSCNWCAAAKSPLRAQAEVETEG